MYALVDYVLCRLIYIEVFKLFVSLAYRTYLVRVYKMFGEMLKIKKNLIIKRASIKTKKKTNMKVKLFHKCLI